MAYTVSPSPAGAPVACDQVEPGNRPSVRGGGLGSKSRIGVMERRTAARLAIAVCSSWRQNEREGDRSCSTGKSIARHLCVAVQALRTAGRWRQPSAIEVSVRMPAKVEQTASNERAREKQHIKVSFIGASAIRRRNRERNTTSLTRGGRRVTKERSGRHIAAHRGSVIKSHARRTSRRATGYVSTLVTSLQGTTPPAVPMDHRKRSQSGRCPVGSRETRV